MKKYNLLLIILLISICGHLAAQTTGDYKSNGNVTLKSTQNWQMWDGAKWVSASRTPDLSTGTITVSTGNTLLIGWSESDSVSRIVINGNIDLKNNSVLYIKKSGTNNDFTLNNNISVDGNIVLLSGTKAVLNKDLVFTQQSSSSFSLAGVELINYGMFSFANRPVIFDLNTNITNQAGATFDMKNISPEISGIFKNYGTLNIASSLTINANSILTNYKNSNFKFSYDGGSVNINGTFNNSTDIDYMSKSLNIASTGVYNSLDGASIKLGWGNVTIAGLLYNTGSITYPGYYNNISFSSAGIYEHAQNGGTIPLISNSSTTGTVRISGVTNTAPSMPAGQTTYNIFEWNCANQISAAPLPVTITINSNLILNNGYITVGNNNQLILASQAVITNPVPSSSFIKTPGNSVVRKYFAAKGTFTYPLGDTLAGGTSNAVTVGFNTGTFSGSSYVDARMTSSKHPNNNSGTSFLNCYWTLTSSNISNYSANVTFKYADANLTGNSSGMFLLRYYNNVWTTFEHPVNNTLSITNLTSFGDFTGGMDGALPVELESFTYSASDRNVNLKWTTLTETNNLGFDIERSTAGKNEWNKIAFVKGNGNKTTRTDYTYLDRKLETGLYEYRLKQTDYNGNFEYHKLSGTVDISIPNKFELLQNYPNPFNPVTKIDFSIPADAPVKLALYDISGREVKVLVNETKNAGYYTITFDASGISSGVYFYKLTSGGYNDVKRMMVIK